MGSKGGGVGGGGGGARREGSGAWKSGGGRIVGQFTLGNIGALGVNYGYEYFM